MGGSKQRALLNRKHVELIDNLIVTVSEPQKKRVLHKRIKAEMSPIKPTIVSCRERQKIGWIAQCRFLRIRSSRVQTAL